MTKLWLGVICASLCWGQAPDAVSTNGSMQLAYFTNANIAGALDGTVQMSNFSGATVCALIYVFRPNEEMAECCGCSMATNALRTLSVNTDLTSQPVGGPLQGSGLISILASAGTSTCDPAAAARPTAGYDLSLLSITHVLSAPGGTYVITETPFQTSTLHTAEQNDLQSECKAIELTTDGGTCTCGTGDATRDAHARR
jgi:hypothetical protein